MLDILTRVWENLLARTEGPLHFRLFIQPAVSLFFAIRAALKDVKNNTTPYLWRFVFSDGKRKQVSQEGWKDYGKIFIIALALDVIYQLIVIYKFKTQAGFYPLESIIVAFALAIVPYFLFRGPVNRIVRAIVKPPKPTSNKIKEKAS